MSDPVKEIRHPILANLRRWFLTGLVIAAPVGITLYIIWSFVGMVDGWVDTLLPIKFGKQLVIRSFFPGFGILLVTLALTVVGALTANVAGRWLVRAGEWMVQRMPIIGPLHGMLKQMFETVISEQSNSFREVVLVEYPRAGAWTIAFLSSPPPRGLKPQVDENYMAVYVPMPPNPIGGHLIFVHRDDIRRIDMTVEEALKYLVSLGIIGDAANAPVPFKPKKKVESA